MTFRPRVGARETATASPRSLPHEELLDLGTGPTRITWRHSPRARRLTLRIDPSRGGVVVILPPRGSRQSGLALLRQHATWIETRLAALPGRILFADGAAVPIDGEQHIIRHAPEARRGVALDDGTISVSGDAAFLPRRVSDFLRGEARRRLSQRVAFYAGLLQQKPRRVAIKDVRTRWGSCSSDGVVMFSWRLVMAPDFVQDYVVAHEMAHLRHLDHGRQFWQLVETLTRNRHDAEAWLKQNGPGLLRVG